MELSGKLGWVGVAILAHGPVTENFIEVMVAIDEADGGTHATFLIPAILIYYRRPPRSKDETRPMRTFAALPLLCFPLIAFGDCTQTLQTWATALHPTLKLDSENAVCKVNPADAGQILAALPFAETADEDRQGDYGLEVLVADATTGKIIAHRYQSAAISSDAIQFAHLSLDTARYQLSPGVRAFGVRVAYVGSSRVNPFGATTLSLFTFVGSAVHQVMSKLTVAQDSGEWDGTCAGDFGQTQRTLSVGEPGKNGFARLRISEKTTGSHAVAKGDDCQETDTKPKTATFTLDYDGSQYGVPSGLSY